MMRRFLSRTVTTTARNRRDSPNFGAPNESFSIAPGPGEATILRLPISPAAPMTPAQTASHRFGRGCSTGSTRLLFLGNFERAWKHNYTGPCGLIHHGVQLVNSLKVEHHVYITVGHGFKLNVLLSVYHYWNNLNTRMFERNAVVDESLSVVWKVNNSTHLNTTTLDELMVFFKPDRVEFIRANKMKSGKRYFNFR